MHIKPDIIHDDAYKSTDEQFDAQRGVCRRVFLYRIIHKVTIKWPGGRKTREYVTGRDEKNTEESEDKLILTLNQNLRRHAVFLKLYTISKD